MFEGGTADVSKAGLKPCRSLKTSSHYALGEDQFDRHDRKVARAQTRGVEG
jgi:hypothetical protein